MAEFARLQEAKGIEFLMKDFFDQLNAIGGIPIALGTWQMTGIDQPIRKIVSDYSDNSKPF
jgi:hypothetical protein